MSLIPRLIFALIFPVLAFAAPRPPLPKPYVTVPFLIDRVPVAEGWVFPREEKSEFAIESAALFEILSPRLKPDVFEALKARVKAEGVLSWRDLEAVGLSVQFSESTLELSIGIPLKFRGRANLDLNPLEDARALQRPTTPSGHLNLRVTGTTQSGGGAPVTQSTSGRAEFVENVNGFVFESAGDYQDTGNPEQWRRQDTRITKDDEDRMIRYTAGDLTLQNRGFQLSPSVAGFSISREFSIQPYRTMKPLGNTEIQIQRPSTLEVYVNGFLYSQLRLNPGRFNVRDFPLVNGQNNVKIKIRDDLGQEETFDFSVLFENSILPEGLHEFSYSTGAPWRESGADRAYDGTGLLTSVFHRYGWSDEVTVGVNFQNYLNQSLPGLEYSRISEPGYFSLEAASRDGGKSSAQKLRYRSLDRMFGVDLKTLFTLEYEHHDDDFTPLSTTAVTPAPTNQRVDAQITRRLTDLSMISIGGTDERGVLETANQKTYRVQAIWAFNPWTRFELNCSRLNGAITEDRYLVSFFWSEPRGKYSVNSYYDSSLKTSNLTLNRNNLYFYDDYRLSANVQNQPTGTSGDLSGEYLTQIGSVRAEQISSRLGGIDSSTSRIGVNTGLAWVGTHAALTQPVTDSFVLVEANRIPPKAKLVINPNGDYGELRGEGQLGPRTATVLRNYGSYYRGQVNLDSTGLPFGYLLDKEFYFVQPTYRSGLLITVDLSAKILVRGRLVFANGEAVAFVSGNVTNAKGELVDNNFFTNKDGRFLLDGLELGEYTVTTERPDLPSFKVTVVEAADNRLSLGDIVLTKAAQ